MNPVTRESVVAVDMMAVERATDGVRISASKG
jgi:hypothetical protein